MELSSEDIERLAKRGYAKEDFSEQGADGINRLKNKGSWCFFYDLRAQRCREYKDRPLGCATYPVILSLDGIPMIDDLCPEGGTIGGNELRKKGRALLKLIAIIDEEARAHLDDQIQ